MASIAAGNSKEKKIAHTMNGSMDKDAKKAEKAEKAELNEAFDKSQQVDQKKRLDYLLKQAEIFTHFMTNDSAASKKTGKPKKNTSAPNNDTSRRSHHDDDEEEDEAGALENTKTSFRFEESPPYINGTMRDYQIRGLNWMISLYENGINGILADEMGLGKTIQTISMIGFLKNYKKIDGPHLIVVPKSTINNWLAEIKRFCPSLEAFILIGDGATRQEIIKRHMHAKNWDVCLVTYEVCLLETYVLKKFRWHYVVVDEAHRLKNEKTRLAQVLRKFKTRNRLLLTGTPLQNNLHELWALLNYLLPDVFDSAADFDTWFDSNEALGGDNDDAVVKRLHCILKPFMLRRIKSEVEKSLLPKKEIKVYVGLSKMQREWYKNILLKNIEVVNNYGETGRMKLDMVLMHLRKCANHPYLFEGAEPGPPYTTDEHIVNNCGKMILLDKLLTKLKAQGHRVLIFSQFSRMLDILEDYLIWRGHDYCRLDGSTSLEDRTIGMETFNAENSTKFVYMLTTRAGGLGINLVTADVVIIYDSDWNPQADLQAMDRAHRIGQQKQVHVFRLITENTIDEKVVERAEVKLHLDKLVIQQGRLTDSKSNQLTKDERMKMIQHGAKYVLSSTESDITDDDIDKILARGEAKTAEQQAELDKLGENALRTFSLDTVSSVYDFEGENFRKKQMETNKSREANKFIIELPRRERRVASYFDREQAAAAAAKGTKKKTVPRVRHPVLQDFMFLNQNRLHELFAIEREEPLTERDAAMKQKLLDEGFVDWTRADLRCFTDALIRHGRSDLESVATSVPGKTREQVLAYNEVFWKRGHALKNFKSIVAAVERGESAVVHKAQMTEALEWKMAQNSRPEVYLTIRYSKNEEYSKEVDRFLICTLHKLGMHEPSVYYQIKNEIQESHLMRYQFFIKSRTAMEIKKRCELLLRLIRKEFEEHQKEQNEPMSDIPGPKAIRKRRGTAQSIESDGAKRPRIAN